MTDYERRCAIIAAERHAREHRSRWSVARLFGQWYVQQADTYDGLPSLPEAWSEFTCETDRSAS